MATSALRDPGALLDSQAWVSIPATSQLRVSTGSVLALLPSPPCFPWEGNPARKGPGSRTLGHVSACAYHTSQPPPMTPEQKVVHLQGSCFFLTTSSANSAPAQKAKSHAALTGLPILFSTPGLGFAIRAGNIQWRCFPGRNF